eukprot:626748-Hanusia_phi.AAC.5
MGAAGALGATMMKTLRGRGWRVIGIDSRQVVDGLRRPPVGMEAGVLWNVLVPTNGANPAEQKKHVIGEMKLMGFGNEEGQKKLDAVLCFNGGFAMGNASVSQGRGRVCCRTSYLLETRFISQSSDTRCSGLIAHVWVLSSAMISSSLWRKCMDPSLFPPSSEQAWPRRSCGQARSSS